jgi:KDO2-lipid IV(A) lauroyltransferase
MRARVEFEGLERVQQAYASGRGVLIFTGHFGYWEMLAIAHGLEIGPLSLLARSLDNPWLEAMLKRIRTCTGNPIIYRRGAVRRVIRALSANQAVGIPIDQHIHGADAVQVEFFKRPVATTSSVAALALRTGAVVIPVFALGLPGGRYRLIYEHPVSPPVDAGPEAVKELTQRCTDVLERYVRQYPELWLWMHRRWRDTTPEIRDHDNAKGINGHRDTV